MQFEFYNSQGLMCSILCSKSALSNNSEMMLSPFSIRLCELMETGSSLFVQIELQKKKTSEREHNDIKVELRPFKKVSFIKRFNESLLNLMKNIFYFILKALFVLKISKLFVLTFLVL